MEKLFQGIGDAFVAAYNKRLQQGFGITLLIIGVAGVILGAVFATQMPLIAAISVGVLSLTALGSGIYLTIIGFQPITIQW